MDKTRRRIREATDGKTIIKVKYAVVDVHEDSYEDGEGKYVQSYDVDGVNGRTFDSIKSLISAIDRMMCLPGPDKDKSKLFSLMEEDDGSVRLVTDVMQNDDGEYPSSIEIEDWKTGDLTLYSAFVDVKVEMFETRKLSIDEVGAAFSQAGITDRS